MKVAIKQKYEIIKDTLYIEFDLKGQVLDFQAGQFFNLTLINPTFTDSKGKSRFFGFINSPTQKESISMVTKTGPSAFKKSLMALPIGSEVEIGNLGGKMMLPEDTTKPLVLITEDIGIAPFVSVLRFQKEKQLPYKITLIYVNDYRNNCLFYDEIINYQTQIPNFKFIPIMQQDLTWLGEKRIIDKELILQYIQSPNDNLYYVTGVVKFTSSTVKVLKEAGVVMNNIVFEIFTGY